MLRRKSFWSSTGRPRNLSISSSLCRTFLTNSGFSFLYTANLVEVEPGLMANTLKSAAGKNHPQRDRVQFIVGALHSRRDKDRHLGAHNDVRAWRIGEVLRRFPQMVTGFDAMHH